MFPVEQITHVGCWIKLSRYLKLFSREIIFEVLQRVKIIPKRHGRTDGQTDRRLTVA